jgi:hypothetical protein
MLNVGTMWGVGRVSYILHVIIIKANSIQAMIATIQIIVFCYSVFHLEHNGFNADIQNYNCTYCLYVFVCKLD